VEDSNDLYSTYYEERERINLQVNHPRHVATALQTQPVIEDKITIEHNIHIEQNLVS